MALVEFIAPMQIVYGRMLESDASKTSYGHMALISKFKNSDIMYWETLHTSPKSLQLIQTRQCTKYVLN